MKRLNFGFDLLYDIDDDEIALMMAEENIRQLDATRLYFERHWNEKSIEFRDQTRCIASFFARINAPVSAKGCSQILIECTSNEGNSKIMNLSGTISVPVKFDYELFSSLSDLDKKKATLELLMTGIRKVADNQNWNVEPFEETYKKIIELEYVNEWIWPKTAKNKDTGLVAKVFVQHEVRCADISIIIQDKKRNEILRKKVITERPHEFAYAIHLGEIKWVTDKKASLLNRTGDKEWSIEI